MAATIATAVVVRAQQAQPPPEWSMNATVIEACSCTMFCPCYFNTKPSAHHGAQGEDHFCKFSEGFKINRGSYGGVSLDGALFWFAGDLGGDFTQPNAPWARLTFDAKVTPEQRRGIEAIMRQLIPMQWGSFETGEGAVAWEFNGEVARATLDEGRSAEVVLRHPEGRNTERPVVIQNLKYWGTKRNDGFVLMPNEVVAWRKGAEAFEYKGTNGFMITFDFNSSDLAGEK
jgi:hypothetical protein